jgi:hypothetical protein
MIRVARLEGVGRISTPLAAIRIAGETKLVVRPVAALATDGIGLGLAAIAFFSTKKLHWKILSGIGGAYMLTAFTVEMFKLIAGPEAEVL